MKTALKAIAYKLYKLKEDISASLFLKPVAQESPSAKKVLVVKPDAIGDYIIFRNFLDNLRKSKKHKGHEIHLLGNAVWKNIFENLDSKKIDKETFLNLGELYGGGNSYRKEILREIGTGFDTIIYPAYSRNSMMDILISKIKAKHKITLTGDKENMSYLEKSFTDKYYTKLVKTKSKFEFDRNREFFEAVIGEKINLPNPKINLKAKQGNYFVVNPGASVKFKQWSPENFAKVVDHLVEKYKSKVYIVGSKSELVLDEKVRFLTKNKSKVEIKNGGSLFGLLKLIAGSRGVVSNETCTPHIAAALGKKVYCIASGIGWGSAYPYPNYKNAIYLCPSTLDKKNPNKKILDVNETTAERALKEIKF